jgi:hypothetical protein
MWSRRTSTGRSPPPRFDPARLRRHNGRVRRDPVRLAILFLLLASFAAPGLVWAGVHGLEHHHEEEAAEREHAASHCREAAPAVGALLHGHAHPEGVPEHGHELVSAPSLRLDPRPGVPPAGQPAAIVLAARAPGSERPVRPVSPPGASPPPLLHLLCTLLI